MSVIKFYLYKLVIAIHKVKKAKVIIIKISKFEVSRMHLMNNYFLIYSLIGR